MGGGKKKEKSALQTEVDKRKQRIGLDEFFSTILILEKLWGPRENTEGKEQEFLYPRPVLR